MTKMQLFALFLCNLIAATIGTGTVGLLPVYLTRLGADPALTGFFLATAFLSLTISTIMAGRLSDRLQRRKALLIAGGILAAPLTWLMSEATSAVQLMLLTAMAWFAAGIIIAMINVLAGLFAEEKERGRVFGILGLSVPLGGLLSGLTSGPIVDRWGFQGLFAVFALLYVGVPIAGLFLKDKIVAPVKDNKASSSLRVLFTTRTFLFLFIASVIAHIANSEALLGRPLIMDNSDFDATAIASTGAVGGLVTLPLPLLIGWLSDRLGRKPFLVLCYLTTMMGLVALAFASHLWHFWAATALQSTLIASLVVGSALITDIFPKESLGVPLSLFNATPWIGFVIGLAGSGAAMNSFGIRPTLIGGALLTLIAIALLIPIQRRQLQVQAERA